MDILLNCLMIFFARLLDVSIGTLRMIFVIKDKKLYGFLSAFIEISVWLVIARQVLSSDDLNIYAMISYALGYATGTLIGSYIEGFLAIGYTAVQMVIKKESYSLVDKIRENGFAVSVIECHGAEGKYLLLFMQVERKYLKKLIVLLKSLDPDAFISTSDVSDNRNGYFIGQNK